MSSATSRSFGLTSPSGASFAAIVKRRRNVSRASISRVLFTAGARPTLTDETSGAKSSMILSFACCWSGMSRSTESTSDTVFSARNALYLARSSSSESAVASAVNPERPAVARMRFSQTTDSVPKACKFRRL
jgi:hypothetical protein